MTAVALALASLSALVGALAFPVVRADAAVIHKYESQITEVPAGSGAPSTGHLWEVNTMAFDSGHLWVAENAAGVDRTDAFDASSLAFVSQLPQPPSSLDHLDSGVAVGHVGGEPQIYVGGTESATSEGVVALFSESGSFLGSWNGTDTPAGKFGQEGVTSIAVDNSTTNPLDWAAGDVYVANARTKVVDVFKPESGGKEKYVTQLTGVSLTEPFSIPTRVAVDELNGDLLVVEYDSSLEGEVVDVFAPSGLEEYTFVRRLTGPAAGPFGYINSVAVDGGDGDIYVAEGGANPFTGAEGDAVQEFGSTGVFLGRVAGVETPAGSLGGPSGVQSVAVDPVSHRVFIGARLTDEVGVVDVFGPNIVVPDVTTAAASELKPESATVNGTVNPLNEGAATCRFVWGATKAFGHTTACSPPTVGEGSSPVAVHAPVSPLEPDTTYWYRLQASNTNGLNEGEPWQDRSFTTPGPGMHGEAVSDVASTSATLDATINPHEAPLTETRNSTYYFEYGASTSYGADAPVLTQSSPRGAAVGSGEGDVRVSQHVDGLATHTMYHYRVVAVSEIGAKREQFVGRDQTFTTQTAGGPLALPDGRAWELVSPVDKHGAVLGAIGYGGPPVQASATGAAMTYAATQPTEAEPQGYAAVVQLLSMRGAGRWSSRDIATPHSAAVGLPVGQGWEYRAFSNDLSSGLVEPQGPFTSLAPEVSPEDTERTPYLRHDSSCTATPGTCYMPLITGASGHADVPPGREFGGNPSNLQVGDGNFVDGTPDLRHAIVTSSVALTPTPIKQGALYEWSAGKPPAEELQLVSELPKGGVAENAVLGVSSFGRNVRHAISDDGSRVFWSVVEGGGTHLYMRDVTRRETVLLDALQPGAPGTGESAEPIFQTASSHGLRAFFIDSQRLIKGAGRFDLYECEVTEQAGKLACRLTDLTPEAGSGPADVEGTVLGASEDGSSLYFVATGVLSTEANATSERAVGGAENLYMLHYDSEPGAKKWEAAAFIASLSLRDESDWGKEGTQHHTNLTDVTARVSPDGGYLAFMSNRSLTGYDNRDAVSGIPDEEVYLYNAQGKDLVCASCDPTGARPTGIENGNGIRLVASFPLAPGTWFAANLPGWTPVALGDAPYQSRYLSNSGRLFFNSSDALVPQDINGNQDVYEYEPVGVGNCNEGSSTLSPRSGGCVGLISAGSSSTESAFLDASEAGGDVFFLTRERLVSEDHDHAVDVYDAHECTAASPCPSPPPIPAPPCTTADACRTAPSAQPSIYGAPPSATFSGSGNALQPASPSGVAPRPPTRAQKLATALRVCRRKKSRKQRTACESKARRQYKATKSPKASARNRSRG